MAGGTTVIQHSGARTTTVGPTLQRFAEAAASANGVALQSLLPIEELEVRTRNTIYRLTVVNGGDARVLVQGGRYFPLPCEVRLNGSTLGGSLLKVGWIGCGFCLEFLHEGQRITTTRVREIHRLAPAPAPSVH